VCLPDVEWMRALTVADLDRCPHSADRCSDCLTVWSYLIWWWNRGTGGRVVEWLPRSGIAWRLRQRVVWRLASVCRAERWVGFGLVSLGIVVWFLAEATDLTRTARLAVGPTQPPGSSGTRGPFSGTKAAGTTYHLPPYSAKFKNEWSSTFTLPCVFMACKWVTTAVVETNYMTCILHKSYSVRMVKVDEGVRFAKLRHRT
jgi:hypothetical protein